MEKIISAIRKLGANIKKDGFTIEVSLEPPHINSNVIPLLYYLINYFENSYFITFKNIPFCLMPDAPEHILHENAKDKHYYYDRLCKLCHLKKECLGWNNSININRNNLGNIKRIPREVILEVTKECNLSCLNCTGYKNKPIEIDLKRVKHVIKDAVRLGVKNVRFTGGEPLLHSRISEMIIYAKMSGCYVTLNTNATLFDEKLIKIVGEHTDNILISLQGFNKESDNLLTKNNSSFQNKIKNIFKLKSKCKGIVRVGSVITEPLINNFEAYVRLIKKLGINDWELYRPIVINHLGQMISKKHFQVITNQLSKLRHSGIKIRIGNPLPFCINKDSRLSKLFFLGGIPDNSRLVLDAAGYFKPNYFINYNLGKQLRNSWEKLILLDEQSQKRLPLRCRNCKSLKWCRGGFRMIKLQGNNTHFFRDPFAPKP